MENENFIINSHDTLNKFLSNFSEIKAYDIDDAFIDTLEIRLEGKDFNSSITPQVMEVFISFQRGIYKLYRLQKYGDINTSLTKAEKDSLQIVVRVEEGSSWYKIYLKAAREAFKKMNGKQALIGLSIITCAVIVPTSLLIYKHIERDKMAFQKDMMVYEALTHATDTGKNVISRIAKIDATIELDKKEYSKKDLIKTLEGIKDKHENTTHTETGDFIITLMQVDFEKDISFINVVHSDSQELYKKVIIQKADVENQEMIHKANEGDTVNLTLIVTRTEENEIKKVILDSIMSQHGISAGDKIR